MSALTISLPESMRPFLEEKAGKEGFSTVGEYIQHLVHEDQRRSTQAEIEALLLEGLDSGQPIEISDEWWRQ